MSSGWVLFSLRCFLPPDHSFCTCQRADETCNCGHEFLSNLVMALQLLFSDLVKALGECLCGFHVGVNFLRCSMIDRAKYSVNFRLTNHDCVKKLTLVFPPSQKCSYSHLSAFSMDYDDDLLCADRHATCFYDDECCEPYVCDNMSFYCDVKPVVKTPTPAPLSPVPAPTPRSPTPMPRYPTPTPGSYSYMYPDDDDLVRI